VGHEDLLRLGVPFLVGLVVGGYLRYPARVALSVGALFLVGYVSLNPEEGERLFSMALGEVERWVQTLTGWVVWAFAQTVNEPRTLVSWVETLVKNIPPMWAFWAGVVGGLRG